MGMEAVLVQVTPQQLEGCHQEPDLALTYVSPDLSGINLADFYAETQKRLAEIELPAELKRLMLQKFSDAQQSAARTQEKINTQRQGLLAKTDESAGEAPKFSLEKDWHILHYALNGTAEGGKPPLSWAIFGDAELPVGEEVDYGPPRYLTPEQVKAVSAALQAVDPESLIDRLEDYEDAKKKRIYLSHTLVDLSDWEYLPDFFNRFRAFYDEAAASGNAIIMKIS